MVVMQTIEYIEQYLDVEYVVTQFTVPKRSTHYENGGAQLGGIGLTHLKLAGPSGSDW
eukprot:COSAG01_NODE_1698_length_9457_cov_26.121073_4_plen_58_part_00